MLANVTTAAAGGRSFYMVFMDNTTMKEMHGPEAGSEKHAVEGLSFAVDRGCDGKRDARRCCRGEYIKAGAGHIMPSNKPLMTVDVIGIQRMVAKYELKWGD